MNVSEIVRVLEAIAPPRLAAEWDNVGLLVGEAEAKVERLLLCIDLTEPVLAEAARLKAGMVMAYHPVIFKPLPRITAAEAPIAYAAARQGIAVYSTHTAMDAAPGGTNDALADLLGLADRRPLEPVVREGQCKVVVFVPPESLSAVAEAAFSAGAGRIGNYYDCGFFCHGIGSFCGGEGTHPTLGAPGSHEVTEELRLEIVTLKARAAEVVAAVRAAHSYEEPAIDVYPLEEYPDGCGLGRIGRLRRGVTTNTLITRIKKAAGLKKVLLAEAEVPAPRGKGAGARKKTPTRHTTAACCAGSCGALFRRAAQEGATFYLTGELHYHDALAAVAAGMTVVCLGHSNSERIMLSGLAERLHEALPKLKVAVAKQDRDPFEIV